MKLKFKRICIYPKDIQRITGKSYRQSARMLKAIKLSYEKRDNEFLTIEEFCLYTGLNIEQVEPLIFG
nr:hypothetical protein [Flavobacterium gelidilacus]